MIRATSLFSRSAAFRIPGQVNKVGAQHALILGASFHSTRSPRNIAAQAEKLVAKVQQSSKHELYHMSHLALAAATPVAVILSPTILNIPVDFAFGAIIPVHLYWGLEAVIEDYVPPAFRKHSITALGALCALMALGLLKINLCGPGITESAKSLWREVPSKTEGALLDEKLEPSKTEGAV